MPDFWEKIPFLLIGQMGHRQYPMTAITADLIFVLHQHFKWRVELLYQEKRALLRQEDIKYFIS
jgi:hypothetical protein